MKKDVILYIGIDGIKRQIETRIVRKYYRNMIEMYNPKARKKYTFNSAMIAELIDGAMCRHTLEKHSSPQHWRTPRIRMHRYSSAVRITWEEC